MLPRAHAHISTPGFVEVLDIFKDKNCCIQLYNTLSL